MVVVSLMTVIVFGLYTMFNQTQKALLANASQVDVLESGRAAMDAIGRSLSQATPAGLTYTNPALRFFAPHLFGHLDYYNPLIQSKLDPKTDPYPRTNVLESCFFLTRANNGWTANGFFVASATNSSSGAQVLLTTNAVAQAGYGTLYQFSFTLPSTNSVTMANNLVQYVNVPPRATLTPAELLVMTNRFERLKNSPVSTVLNQPMANPLIDGVVHFRIRPFDVNSRPYMQSVPPDAIVLPDALAPTDQVPFRFYFYGRSVPAFLELELGIIDPQILQKVKAMPSLAARRAYLQDHIGAVQLFHKMIPLRNSSL